MRNRSTPGHFALALAVVTAALTATPARSQNSPPAAKQHTALEEVIVTAERRETSLQTTAISITAFTQQRIEDLGVSNVSQISGYAPNLSISEQPSSNSNMGIFIRGIGEGETSLLQDPKVGMYIDGIFMSKTVGAVFNIVDLKRIEVLRGPQGTLFGRNTSGGAINVVTVKPTGHWGVKAKATYARFNYWRYGATVNLPAVDNVAAQLTAYRTTSDGWAKNDYTGPPVTPAHKVEKNLGSLDNKAWRIALRWTPTDAITIDYTYDRTKNSGVPAPFQIVKVKDSYYNGFTNAPIPYTYLGGQLYQDMAATVGNPHHRRRHYMLDAVTKEWLDVKGQSLIAQWDLGDVKLKYLFGDRKTDSGYGSTDLDGGAYVTTVPFYGVNVPTPGFHASIPKGYIEMHSHEFQIIGDAFDNKLNYTTGLFYYSEKVYQSNPQTFSLPIALLTANAAKDAQIAQLLATYNALGFCSSPTNPFSCIGSQRLPLPFPFPGADPNGNGLVDFIYGQNTRSWAVYGQATYAFTPKWSLTLGLRYTNDYKNAFLFNESIVATPSYADRINADHSWDNVSYLANLSYQVTPDAMVYAKYSTGYDSGGYNARATTVAGFEKPYNKEEVKAYEMGLKSEWFERRLRLNASVFRNSYTDIQIAQFEAGSGGASSVIVNAGKGTYQGMEFDITAVPIDGMTIYLNYGYLDAQFNTYDARDPASGNIVDISNVTTVPHAPKYTGSANIDYRFGQMSFGYFSAHVGASYRSKIVFHPFQNQYDSSNSYWLYNARFSLNDIPIAGGDAGKLRISLWGKNLADKQYRNWGIDFASLGFAGDVYGEPRTFGIDVVYNYD